MNNFSEDDWNKFTVLRKTREQQQKNIHLQTKGVTGSGHDEESKKTTDIPIDPLFLKKEKFKKSIEQLSKVN